VYLKQKADVLIKQKSKYIVMLAQQLKHRKVNMMGSHLKLVCMLRCNRIERNHWGDWSTLKGLLGVGESGRGMGTLALFGRESYCAYLQQKVAVLV
jgi:hypothetical protein